VAKRYRLRVAEILIIEDDLNIRSAMARALAALGHDVVTEASGMAGLQASLDGNADVVILDLGLPDVDGGEVLRMIRAVRDVPVIVATARDDEREIVRLLDAGADDYVVKPFSSELLEARIRAVLRRGDQAAGPTVHEVGGLRVDVDAREVQLDGMALDLTRREFDLLAYLIERAGAVVTKRQLLADIWRQPYGGADKTVDVHLSWLRRKLGESAREPRYLHTIRGVGIKLSAPPP
jgi:DNA-binding response OmpR family regulator